MEHQIEAVIHFAASAYVGESVKSPRKYFANNVVNTLNLLNALVDFGIGAIVFSSTCATYGIPDRTPICEDHDQAPINPYGESKLFVERALQWYAQAYGIRVAILRYFNAAGADPEGELGESHNPETHLIPLAIEAASGRGPALPVFGNRYPTKDGTCVRDYVHVDDLARAHVLALQKLEDQPPSFCKKLNLGTGKGHSVLEVLHAVGNAVGRRVPANFREPREGDPPVLVADASQAASWLGWSPQYDLQEIVDTAWRWHHQTSRPAIGLAG
jgi:UDP-glucose-4-epimerase GalE